VGANATLWVEAIRDMAMVRLFTSWLGRISRPSSETARTELDG